MEKIPKIGEVWEILEEIEEEGQKQERFALVEIVTAKKYGESHAFVFKFLEHQKPELVGKTSVINTTEWRQIEHNSDFSNFLKRFNRVS